MTTPAIRSPHLAFAVALCPTVSAGGSHAQAFMADQRTACTPDAFRLCSSEMPSIPASTACMSKNRSNLSQACKAVFPK